MRGLHAALALAGFPSRKKKSDRKNSKMSVFIPQPYRRKSLSPTPAVGPVQVLAVNNASTPSASAFLFLLTVDLSKITCPGSPTRAFSAVSDGTIWAECKGEGAIVNPMPTLSAILVHFCESNKARWLFLSSLMAIWVALSKG